MSEKLTIWNVYAVFYYSIDSGLVSEIFSVGSSSEFGAFNFLSFLNHKLFSLCLSKFTPKQSVSKILFVQAHLGDEYLFLQ